MADDTQVPVGFGWRYIGWALWSHSVTILASLQGVFAAILLATDSDPTNPLLPHKVVRWINIGNAALIVIVAQFKKSAPTPQEGKK